jgi:hypothetical protein
MKVMQELAAYFDRRGRLSKKQLHALLDRGFLAADAPPNMQELADAAGASFYFRVTGAADGPLWGTDVYTGDSSLAAAAVHAGLANVGETKVIRVTIVQPLSQYTGSTRNGVTSHDFGRYGSAYRLSAL